MKGTFTQGPSASPLLSPAHEARVAMAQAGLVSMLMDARRAMPEVDNVMVIVALDRDGEVRFSAEYAAGQTVLAAEGLDCGAFD